MTTRPRDHVTKASLPALAEVVARWVDDVDDVPAVYLFGSRARGDHNAGSDLDVVVQPPPAGIDGECLRWWLASRASDGATAEVFGPLREAVLPMALHLAHTPWDPAQGWADNATLDVISVVLRVRKAVCL